MVENFVKKETNGSGEKRVPKKIKDKCGFGGQDANRVEMLMKLDGKRIAKLSRTVDKLTDIEDLQRVASFSGNKSARVAAVEKLTKKADALILSVDGLNFYRDELGRYLDSLKYIARNSPFADAKCAAAEKLTVMLNEPTDMHNVHILMKIAGCFPIFPGPLDNIELAATKKIITIINETIDAKLLIRIAVFSPSFHEDISSAAVEKLAGMVNELKVPRALDLVASDSKNKDARMAAVEKLAEIGAVCTLDDVASYSSFADTKRVAKEKLTAIAVGSTDAKILMKIAGQLMPCPPTDVGLLAVEKLASMVNELTDSDALKFVFYHSKNEEAKAAACVKLGYVPSFLVVHLTLQL